MKAVHLTGYEGIDSLRIVEVDSPTPGPNQILIQVKAAGINFAEIELVRGRYVVPKTVPFTMGFEGAGVVVALGSQVTNFKIGDRVTTIVASGGYADYAIADAGSAIPIPDGVSFAEASSIPVQGLSAFAILKLAAKPQPTESLLIQAAAGGVGLYLIQLAKIMGVKTVIALVGSERKLALVRSIGADVAINYSESDWAEQVRSATGGKGVDIVLEAASGEVGAQSFKLMAPFGRMVMFGARNIHDSLGPDKLQQLIYKNQSITGFNIPSLQPEQIAGCVPLLLSLISQGKVKLFADNLYPLAEVRTAFQAISDRHTVGKVVLTP
jgi:NADPH:quinone reductase